MEAEWTTAGQPPRQAGECVELSAACLCLLSTTAVIANKQRRNQQRLMNFLSQLIGGIPMNRKGNKKQFANNTERRTMRVASHFLRPQKKGG